jgi:hypothetical protein
MKCRPSSIVSASDLAASKSAKIRTGNIGIAIIPELLCANAINRPLY